MKEGPMQEPAAQVPAREKQAADAPAAQRRLRWQWVQASVWTDRMLAALENGVQGGSWFSLIDKVGSARNLASAWAKVARNDGAAGVDHVTVAMFEKHLETKLPELSQQLQRGTYCPQAVRR